MAQNILSSIYNILDRLGNWFLPLLAGTISLIFTSVDFFDLYSNWKIGIYCIGAFLTILFVICSIAIERNRPRIKQLVESNDEKQELIDRFADNIFIFFDGLSLNLAKRVGIENNSNCRISIYLHFKAQNCFIRCGRYADNPKLARGGRPEYPEDEGCISKGWRLGWYYVGNLPARRDRHQRKCEKDYNIPKATHDDFVMLSRCIAAKRLSLTSNRPLAVIVVESLDKDAFSETALKGILESVSDDYAEAISVFHKHIIESHTSKGVEQ